MWVAETFRIYKLMTSSRTGINRKVKSELNCRGSGWLFLQGRMNLVVAQLSCGWSDFVQLQGRREQLFAKAMMWP